VVKNQIGGAAGGDQRAGDAAHGRGIDEGARERALAVCQLLKQAKLEADLYVGLEGGFHTIVIDGGRKRFYGAGRT